MTPKQFKAWREMLHAWQNDGTCGVFKDFHRDCQTCRAYAQSPAALFVCLNEIERLQTALSWFEAWRDLTSEGLDLELLRKLASGEGGQRTGALKRAGYLEWTVTEAGTKALEAEENRHE